MCIEYNECHYGGMYNVYVKRKIFIITEIVHMNVGVSSEKEKVKESQTVTKCDTLALHPLWVPGWGRHTYILNFESPTFQRTPLLQPLHLIRRPMMAWSPYKEPM